MKTGTSISAWLTACRVTPRSARACGRHRTRWPTCWRRRSRTRKPAPPPHGYLRRQPRRCTRCTITRSTCRHASRNWRRSEEHTSELQSRLHLVCRLLLEKKKKKNKTPSTLKKKKKKKKKQN